MAERDTFRALPITTRRTFESAIDAIVEEIDRLHLRAGTRLPNENELADQLGISKPTLRQAVRVLQRSGLIEVRPGKSGGLFVAADTIPLDAISGIIAVEENAVLELLHARRLLEPVVVRLAAEAATGDDIANIQRTIDMVRPYHDGRNQLLRIDAMFHRSVSRACHNRFLQRALAGIYRDLGPLHDSFVGSVDDAVRMVRVHQQQLDAMTARDWPVLDAVMDECFRPLEERFNYKP